MDTTRNNKSYRDTRQRCSAGDTKGTEDTKVTNDTEVAKEAKRRSVALFKPKTSLRPVSLCTLCDL